VPLDEFGQSNYTSSTAAAPQIHPQQRKVIQESPAGVAAAEAILPELKSKLEPSLCFGKG